MAEKESKKTVLVVDDEEDIRRYLSAALEEAGFNVLTAFDGDTALNAIKTNRPDLISLDLVMPKKSGVKFHRELIKNKDWARIPVIIVTGHARDDLGRSDLRELTMSGPELYLEKPVNPENYIAAVKKLLGMEVSEVEAESVEKVKMQNEIKDLLDNADLSELEKIKRLLKEK
jgi:DNA-binding response OmpR family regulator